MKKILLTPAMNYYRVNLHCHSTVSDGRKSPEELKAFYLAHGYSALAFTDHEAFITHNELTDESFVALNGYELDVSAPDGSGRTCHICFVALDPDTDTDVCYHRTKYFGGNTAGWRSRVHFDENAPDFERVYSREGINRILEKGRSGGFFVTYNHPTWSLESYPEYSGYHGMHAMEISNYNCQVGGFDDDNGHAYDDMLRGGERIFCISTDDNHNAAPDDDPCSDSFGGYVMVNAPRLGYRELTDALQKGHFYSSTGTSAHVGPEIRSLEFEDGTVHVTTSEVRSVALITCSRACRFSMASAGKTLCEATFRVRENEPWFRLVVTDREGYKAYSNAYFPKDLKQDE